MVRREQQAEGLTLWPEHSSAAERGHFQANNVLFYQLTTSILFIILNKPRWKGCQTSTIKYIIRET